jgi:hypothetical protein
MSRHSVIIGRTEYIDVVDIVLNVPTKIDTGAFRSAIHATDINIVTVDGQEVLKCNLLGHPCSPVVRPFETTDFKQVIVTNSFGHDETRYEISLKVKLGPKIFKTSFTLADRSRNLFPVLAGRKLLKDRFYVDVSKTSVDRLKLKKEFNIDVLTDEEDLE